MTLTMLLPCFTVLGSIAAMHVAWWALGDLVLEHVGIPFLDAGTGKRRAMAADRARRGWSA
jgi:hypothetical protein